MKFVSSKEQGKIDIEEIPVPEPNEGEVLIKMRACGICGSDLEKVYAEYGLGSKRIGHELAGEIAKLGEGVSDFSVGDRVFVRQRVPCNECHYCDHGDHTVCDVFKKTNVDPCGLSEYFIASQLHVENGAVIKLPDNISFEEAAASEPLSCCVRALNKCSIQKNDSVAIIGAGPVGIMFSMLLKPVAGKIFIIDINEKRLEFAKKFGRTINSANEDPAEIVKKETGIGADLVIVATGAMQVLDSALKMTRRGGSIFIFGVPPKGSPINYDANYLFVNEILLLTGVYSVKKDIEKALDHVASGRVDLKQLITHRFPIEESQEAFETAHRGEGMKIVITAGD